MNNPAGVISTIVRFQPDQEAEGCATDQPMTRPSRDSSMRIHVGPMPPDCRDDVLELFNRLSDHARYQRFLAPKHRLSRQELAHLGSPDGRDHFAIGAWDLAAIEPKILGIGRFHRLPHAPRHADLAIAVVDACQRRGIATRLLHALAVAASQLGIDHFSGEYCSANRAVRVALSRLEIPAEPLEQRTMRCEIPVETVLDRLDGATGVPRQ